MAERPAPKPDPRPRSAASDETSSPAATGDRPDPSAALPVGMPREVGQFTIQRVIGSGGMATVYAALQRQPRRTVALKVMKAGMAASLSDASLRRFKREIEILGKLHHPFIAAVYDAGTFDAGSGPTPDFVMEYIAGARTILEYVVHKDLDVRDRLKLFVKVCAAVEHGHGHKVIHRDLKPGNILIDEYGEPKIIDFGIAHAAELDASQQTMQTEAGRLVGTLQYMAPEQVDTRPQDLDGRCDVYALGVLLYKMMTGKPPYDLEGLPVFEALRIIREERPRRPSDINPEVKGDLETVILKAMEHDRARRYRNAGSLGRDVVRYLANKPINARRAGLVYRATLFAKRNAVIVGVIGVIAVVVLVAGGVILWERARLARQRGEQTESLTERELQLKREREEIARAQTAARPSVPPSQQPILLEQHTARVNRLMFVPDIDGQSNTLISASSDHSIIIWGLKTASMLQRISSLGGAVEHLAMNGDGSVLAAATGREGDGIVLTRFAEGAGETERTIRDLGGDVTALAMPSDGSAVAWGASNLMLSVLPLDPQTLQPRRRDVQTIRSSTGPFRCIAFGSSATAACAAGTERGTIVVWDGKPGSAPQRLPGLKSAVIALALIDAGGTQRLIAVADDGGAMVWSASKGGAGGAAGSWSGAPFRAADKPIVVAVFSPNGAHLAVATADGAQVWTIGDSPAAPQRVGNIIKTEDTPTAVAITDTGDRVALGMLDGDVRVIAVDLR